MCSGSSAATEHMARDRLGMFSTLRRHRHGLRSLVEIPQSPSTDSSFHAPNSLHPSGSRDDDIRAAHIHSTLYPPVTDTTPMLAPLPISGVCHDTPPIVLHLPIASYHSSSTSCTHVGTCIRCFPRALVFLFLAFPCHTHRHPLYLFVRIVNLYQPSFATAAPYKHFLHAFIYPSTSVYLLIAHQLPLLSLGRFSRLCPSCTKRLPDFVRSAHPNRIFDDIHDAT